MNNIRNLHTLAAQALVALALALILPGVAQAKGGSSGGGHPYGSHAIGGHSPKVHIPKGKHTPSPVSGKGVRTRAPRLPRF